MRSLCRRRTLLAATVALLLPAAVQGQEADQLKLKVGGVYNAWFQNQQNFLLGQTDYDDKYIVQMLRLNVNLGYGDYIKAVTRIDMAQGWWGVDNDDWRGSSDADDNNTNSARFSNKDTNYAIHVDVAYLEFLWPGTKLTTRVGRMFYGLGNRLSLDSNFDGIQMDYAVGSGKFGLGWAKVSEGVDALTDLDQTGNNGPDGDDADLFMATLDGKSGSLGYGLYGMYYADRGDDDNTTFMPNGIDYLRARFTPHISSLNIIGATATYTHKPAGLTLQAEANYLTGKDDVANATSGANQLVDINNGDLSGYNLYGKLTKTLGPKADLGLVAGMGSGDADPGSGDGNVNKLKTMGFFYLTEVWEESIMPDEEGITPQGLGAPNVRGYRELENTTVLQASLAYRPTVKLRGSTSYSLIRSTEPVRGWADANSNNQIEPTEFSTATSSDIGTELDFLVGYKPYPRLDLILRGGYMWAGDAARLLINGNTNSDKNPWELKAQIEFTF